MFAQAGLPDHLTAYATVILFTESCLVCLITTYLTEKLGRRPLLFYSVFGIAALFICVMGFSLGMGNHEKNLNETAKSFMLNQTRKGSMLNETKKGSTLNQTKKGSTLNEAVFNLNLSEPAAGRLAANPATRFLFTPASILWKQGPSARTSSLIPQLRSRCWNRPLFGKKLPTFENLFCYWV